MLACCSKLVYTYASFAAVITSDAVVVGTLCVNEQCTWQNDEHCSGQHCHLQLRRHTLKRDHDLRCAHCRYHLTGQDAYRLELLPSDG